MSPPVLCLVTDRLRSLGRPIEDVVAAAVEGGVSMVQLREKDLPSRKLHDLAVRMREITAGRALLFINDRVDLALAVGAEGVHLGEEGLPVRAARSVAGGRLLIGRSVHAVATGIAAEQDGADLLVAGSIFQTSSHPNGTPHGTALLEQLRRTVSVPLVAIGGITPQNVREVVYAGASGVAVISAITQSADPREAAGALASSLAGAWHTVRA